MNPQNLFHLYLVLHITGFTMMAGATVAQLSIFKRLNKYVISDKQKALSILESTGGFARIMGIGGLLLIVTGIGMVSILRDAATSMVWFRIKMPLVILILLNGGLYARLNANKLKKWLQENTIAGNGPIEIYKNRLRIFNISQLIIFLLIFIVSVYQF